MWGTCEFFALAFAVCFGVADEGRQLENLGSGRGGDHIAAADRGHTGVVQVQGAESVCDKVKRESSVKGQVEEGVKCPMGVLFFWLYSRG